MKGNQGKRDLREINLQAGLAIFKGVGKRICSISNENFIGLGLVDCNSGLGVSSTTSSFVNALESCAITILEWESSKSCSFEQGGGGGGGSSSSG